MMTLDDDTYDAEPAKSMPACCYPQPYSLVVARLAVYHGSLLVVEPLTQAIQAGRLLQGVILLRHLMNEEQ
jgi:hypothetical protein